MKTIRWGIIGAGRISSTFAEALNGTEGAELAAVASRSMQRAREFAKKYNAQTTYSSYKDIATDETIDVIYIGTPHTEHRKNAEICIRAGKNVLCEKPLTLNTKDTEFLIQLAKEYHVFFMEAMWTKFQPVTKMVKEAIHAGRIGSIKYINVRFGYYAERNSEDRLLNPTLGGGALLDVGIYPITYAVHMLEQLPKKVTGAAQIGDTGVDEVNSILMEFKNGVIADLASSVTVEIGKDARIVGDKGYICIRNFWHAEQAEFYDNDGNLLETLEEPFQTNGYEYEIMEVNNCIREGRLESELLPLKDTKDIMKIMDELRKQWGLVYPQEKE